MGDELLKKVEALEEQIRLLTARVWQLEQRAAGKPAGPREAPAVSPTVTAESRAAEAVAPPVEAQPVQAAATAEEPPGENLETKIGRYWLNRIGIVALVLSVAFFILYNFPRLGPHMKILFGYLAGVALMVGGLRIERQHALRWYGRGLLGGAWAVLYFTTYAMYHTPTVRIVHSAFLDLALLLLVAGGAVTHAMKYRSQVITAVAFLLGFLTITISTVSSFTLIAGALLIIAIVGLTVRMKWHGFCFYTVLFSYLTYVTQVSNDYMEGASFLFGLGTPETAGFWLNASFLTLFWVGYVVASLGLDEETRNRKATLVAIANANGLLFVYLLMVDLNEIYPGARSLVLAGVGLVYGVLTRVARIRRLPGVSTAHLLLALAFVSLAVAVEFSDRWTTVLWSLEVPLLVWLGFRVPRTAFRAFAIGLAVVTLFLFYRVEVPIESMVTPPGAPAVTSRLLVGLLATAAFGLAAAAYRLKRHRPHFAEPERHGFHAYFLLANAVIWPLALLEPARYSVPFYVALVGTVVFLLGWWLPDRFARLLGGLWFLCAGTMALGTVAARPPGWDLLPCYGVAALSFAVGLVYTLRRPREPLAREALLRHAYTALGAVVLTAALLGHVTKEWLTLAWGAEGFALVALGFALGERTYRISGLSVFGVLVLKILFVDLAGAETVYRILSFLIVGVVLLLASYAYGMFSGRDRKSMR